MQGGEREKGTSGGTTKKIWLPEEGSGKNGGWSPGGKKAAGIK